MTEKDHPGISGDVVVYRIGGCDLVNFQLKPKERDLQPPGISVFLGGTADEAVKQLMGAYPDHQMFSALHALAKRVASATVDKIKEAGFAVMRDPTKKFPNHGRLIHPKGADAFTAAISELAKAFTEPKV